MLCARLIVMELLVAPVVVMGVVPEGHGHGGFVLTTADGRPLGTIGLSITRIDGVFGHWLSTNGRYPFTLTLYDPSGAVVLVAEKARQRTYSRFLRVAVRLADGRAIGTAHQRFPMSRLRFYEDDDAEVASAASGRHTSALTVRSEPGRDIMWAGREFDLGRAGLAGRVYRLTFADDAPVLVRTLLIAHTAAADLALLGAHGAG